VIALPWLYDAASRLRHLVVEHDLDTWIARADDALFPGRWYLVGANWPLAALELAHAVYFSYYLLLFVPALVAERRQQNQVDLYVRALTATLLAHYALNFSCRWPGRSPSAPAPCRTGSLPTARGRPLRCLRPRRTRLPEHPRRGFRGRGLVRRATLLPERRRAVLRLGGGDLGLDRGLRLPLPDRCPGGTPDGGAAVALARHAERGTPGGPASETR